MLTTRRLLAAALDGVTAVLVWLMLRCIAASQHLDPPPVDDAAAQRITDGVMAAIASTTPEYVPSNVERNTARYVELANRPLVFVLLPDGPHGHFLNVPPGTIEIPS